MNTASLSNLPNDVLLKVFSYAFPYPQDLQAIGETCKKFHVLASHNFLWKKFIEHRFYNDVPGETENIRNFYLKKLKQFCTKYYAYTSYKPRTKNIFLVAGEILSTSIKNNSTSPVNSFFYQFTLKPTSHDIENSVENYTTRGMSSCITLNLPEITSEVPLEKVFTSKKHFRDQKISLLFPLMVAGSTPTRQTLNIIFDEKLDSFKIGVVVLAALDNEIKPSKLFTTIRGRDQFQYEDNLRKLLKFSNPSLLTLEDYLKLKKIMPSIIKKIQVGLAGTPRLKNLGNNYLSNLSKNSKDYFSTLSAEPLRTLCNYLSPNKMDLETLKRASSLNSKIIKKSLKKPLVTWEDTKKIMSQFRYIKQKADLIEQQDQIVKTVFKTEKNLSALSQLLELGYRINSVYLDIALYRNQRHLINVLLNSSVKPSRIALDVCVQYSRHKYLLPLFNLGARPTTRTKYLRRQIPKYEMSLLGL